MNASTKFSNTSIKHKNKDSFLVRRNYLTSTEMCYKSCFNGYTGILEYMEVMKLFNRNIKKSKSFLYNILGCKGF